MITHNSAVDPTISSPISIEEQQQILRQLRSELLLIHRPNIQKGAGPIRVMARIVAELERGCRERNIAEEVIGSEVVNRTIGDVNLRLVTECEGEAGGAGDYRLLADELGIALPGEDFAGYIATGETYLWLRNQMMECERMLLQARYDPRMYDIYGVGSLLFRGWLADEMRKWGVEVPGGQVFLSLGAMDGIDKTLRGLAVMFREQGHQKVGMLFPEPGFGVPEMQAQAFGYQLHHFLTLPEKHFKLSAQQLDELLQCYPDTRIVYLTVTNNPTTFAYTPQELNELHEVLRMYRNQGREVLILADLAYVGTGKPEEDRARMATFMPPDVLQHTIFVSSLSKTFTLTGDRFGWVTVGDPAIASAISSAWTNSNASLPAEWQLRYMACYRLLQERPWLGEKLRAFYRLRRQRLIAQLQRVNEVHHLFEEIYVDDDATVYNWSRVHKGEDAFTVFEKTGIAGVPGSGFGYTDEYIRFSIGVIPVPCS